MKSWCVMAVTAAVFASGCADVDDVTTEAEAIHERGNPNPNVAPPRSRPYGHSYGEWEARWWQWAMRIPNDRNPILDATGAHCAEGQSGPVWFLAGNYGGVTRRECTVPRGRALFVPLLNQVWWQTLQDDPANTIPWMYGWVRDAVRGAQITASLDGRPVVEPTRYYEETPVFTTRFPTENPWGFDATWLPVVRGLLTCDTSVDAGYALMIHPLPPGDHTLHFEGANAGGFSLDVTYTLHVR